jgi:hypothetical protein
VPPVVTPAPPVPTPIRTPSPTPEKFEPDGKCTFRSLSGECSLEGACNGVHIANGAGALGCTHLTTAGVGCCIQSTCTVRPLDGSASLQGVCRGVALCRDAGLASYPPELGGTQCENFPLGNECCTQPTGGAPPTPAEIKEFACQVGTRPGICKPPELCTAPSVWLSRSTAGFDGCVNSALFESDGCCAAADGTIGNEPTGECTLENPVDTCSTGRVSCRFKLCRCCFGVC